MSLSNSGKALRILGATLMVYAVLVVPNEGEFWPFSIYPMFSQAGNPWTRAMVREVPADLAEDTLWQPADLDDVPGDPLPLQTFGLFQNDLANYVSKTTIWDESHMNGIRAMFDTDDLRHRNLMVYKVRGSLATPDSVAIHALPLIYLTPEAMYLNPSVERLE